MMTSVPSQHFPPPAPALLPDTGTPDPAHSSARAERLAELYAEHFAFVWRSAKRLGVPLSAVDDAVQDVFLVAHHKLHEFEGRSSLRTWLFGITRKVVREHRPNRTSAPREAADLDALPSQDVGPLRSAEQAQSARLLQLLLDELEEERRAAFILVDLEELSVPEAAEVLGVNLNTLYSRVRAARQDLSKSLTRLRARSERSEPWNR
jgi:RNA polymerase sigma-70 factor (ECF subfamily)